MRISIREQLGALVLVSALIGIAVVAIATWVTNYNFVLGIRASRLSLTASLKAAQLNSNLVLMQAACRSASTRLIIQGALQRYNLGNNTDENWSRSRTDLAAALEGGQAALLLQGQVTPSDPDGLVGYNPVFNATGDQVPDLKIRLPYNDSNGDPVYLAEKDKPTVFPPALYPTFSSHPIRINDTYVQNAAVAAGTLLTEKSLLILGPYIVNETFSLISMTLPIINNTSNVEILGWLTIVMDGRLISDVLHAEEGLGKTGLVMLVGPNNASNHFPPGVRYDSANHNPPQHLDVRFVLPINDTLKRHSRHDYGTNETFDYNTFPAAKKALTERYDSVNNAGSMISTKNEQGANIAVGFAMPRSEFVDWVLLVEQSHNEVWQPITQLRKILLACVFGTAGAVLLLAFPLAHYFSAQVRRLRDATQRTVVPPGVVPIDSSSQSRISPDDEDPEAMALARKEGFLTKFTPWKRGSKLTKEERREEARRRQFNIPSKVPEQKHFIKDELTELTEVFNEMCDELYVNYERLEEKVRERTAELELAKQAAEAANRSKTLFIANISHELKTPLNGILNYAAEAMIEENPDELRENAGFIYRSGQILLNLVQDVLTFAQNQSTQLSIVEHEFRLRHVVYNVKALFKHQASEAGIALEFKFSGPTTELIDENANLISQDTIDGPMGSGRVKDMVLWGDSQRLGQVLINLVSNALKFTPQGGRVTVSVRCIEEVRGDDAASRRSSSYSRQPSIRNSGRNSRARSRLDSASNASVITPRLDTANEINALEKPKIITRLVESERTISPPPGRMMLFEFEVEDTGSGVPPDLQERIFEPFVQGDLSLSKKHAGTGLGLSICSQLAKAMNGTITLYSDGATGSTFTMRIPLRYVTTRANSKASSTFDGEDRRNSTQSERIRTPVREIEQHQQQQQQQSVSALQSLSEPGTPTHRPINWPDPPTRMVGLSTPFLVSNNSDDGPQTPSQQKAVATQIINEATQRMGKLRILVAEDNWINQNVVKKLVARYEKESDVPEGVDLTIAPDGNFAVEAVKQSMESGKKYDLIFMDIQMPHCDGIQATRQIRALGYNYPILGLSSYSENHNIKECMDAGMNTFIPKPIDKEKLRKAVKVFVPPTIKEADEEGLAGPSRSTSNQPTPEDELPSPKTIPGLTAKAMDTPSPGVELPPPEGEANGSAKKAA